VTVYLFFDESGNLDFSPSGTRYYCFGALTTRDPGGLTHILTELRYKLTDEGNELEAFHAAEDKQYVRNRVFEAIGAIGNFDFDAVIVEKRKTNPVLHDQARFYPKFAGYLLEHVFRRYSDPTERIIVITDRLPLKRHRDAVEKTFKQFIKQKLGDRPFSIVHHSSAAHACLQAADYCMWAVYKKWSVADRRSYDLVKPFLKSEFDIFRTGTEYFY
jgi:hypothetical protein